MVEQIAVDADLLRTHAVRVEQGGAEVKVGADAAGSVDLGGGAFGVLCGFLVLPAQLVSFAGQSVVSSAGQLVDRAAVQVRGWAGDVEEQEQQIAQEIARLERLVDGL